MMQEGTETAPTGDPHHLHFQDLHSAGSVVDIRHVVSSCLPPAITSARTEEDEEDNARDHPAAEYPQRRDTYNHHHPHGDHQDGTVDGDLSFLYLHYDRMCDSATAQGRTQEHSCPHNVLPLMLPSLLGRQHDEQLHPAAIKEEPHDDHARLLQSIYSPSLRNGTTSPPISAHKDHHHCCPDNSDSEDSFDDEIYRLFGCGTDEQKRGTRKTKYATVRSLKPRTTTTTTQEESLLVVSFLPSVTPDNVATLATTRNLKLVSPSPQPGFESSQHDSSSLARCVIPFGGTSTGTTNKGSSLPLYPMQWWSCQDNREDDFTPPSCRASTNHHDGLSKMNMIPFPPPESQPAIPAQGSTLYSTMSSSNNQETTSTAMLPQGVPMTPPPLLYSAPLGTILHATTGTTTATTTTPRPLPFLIDKSLSSSLHDYHTPIKMHLVSPLLPGSQIRSSSSSGTVSAFASRNGARNNPPLEQDQARKRLLFGDDEMMSDLCPTPSSLPFLQSMKKRLHALHNNEKDHDQYTYHDPSSSSLQTMITVGQTSTNLFVGGPSSSQSQPRPTSTLDGIYSFIPGDHDGATAKATSLHEPPHDQRPVMIDKQDGKAGATGKVESSSSSSSLLPMSCEKRLYFWAFQSRTWTARFREAQAYRLKNGHCRIPENYPENIALGRWAKRQRSQYKIRQRTCLSEGNNENMMQYQQHDEGGSITTMNRVKKVFVGGENCQEQEQAVVHEEKGPRVTTTFKAGWLIPQPSGTSNGSAPTCPAGSSPSDGYEEIDTEGQRHDHDGPPAAKEGSSSSCNPLTEERIRLLESIGFVWDLQACDWVHRYDQLLEYKLLHGHADVPQKYPRNQPLSTWVRTQRRSYAKGCMPSDRIEQLDRIVFDWENPSAKKKKI